MALAMQCSTGNSGLSPISQTYITVLDKFELCSKIRRRAAFNIASHSACERVCQIFSEKRPRTSFSGNVHLGSPVFTINWL